MCWAMQNHFWNALCDLWLIRKWQGIHRWFRLCWRNVFQPLKVYMARRSTIICVKPHQLFVLGWQKPWKAVPFPIHSCILQERLPGKAYTTYMYQKKMYTFYQWQDLKKDYLQGPFSSTMPIPTRMSNSSIVTGLERPAPPHWACLV